MQQTIASKIGPVEQVRRGYLVGVAYDPEFGEFILAAISKCGQGKQYLLPSWTELYREAPKKAKQALLQMGAQISLGQLPLLA